MTLTFENGYINESIDCRFINGKLIIDIDDKFLITSAQKYPELFNFMDEALIKPTYITMEFGIFEFDCKYYEKVIFIGKRVGNDWYLVDFHTGKPAKNFIPKTDLVRDQLKRSCRAQINEWLERYCATPIYSDINILSVVSEYEKLRKSL